MQSIISHPGLEQYHRSFRPGDTIFREGDESQDLYILLSGRLAVQKGLKDIIEVSKPGSFFGEMSFLLQEKRTATIKATSDVTAIRIPGDRISDFLQEFPPISPELAKILAERLRATTTVLHGLREYCDSIPDAVILTDMEFKILAWNKAAENLYGRNSDAMRGNVLHEIYEDQAAYKQFLDQLSRQQSIGAKPLLVKHPQDCWKFVATSTATLFDGQKRPNGYLFLGRDATETIALQKKTRRLLFWLVPAAFVLGVAAATLLGLSP